MAFEQLVNADLKDGTIADLQQGEVLVQSDPAKDLDLEVGSVVPVTFQNGKTTDLTVAGIYGDATFGNWLISLDTLGVGERRAGPRLLRHRQAGRRGRRPRQGDAAVDAAMEPFPQANVQTNAEFRASQEAQINQLLVVISMLLAFAIIIAILGISITLALGVFERTREIGLLRAVGMNRRQTRRSVRWEAIIVSTFGAIVGVVLGTFLGVVLSLAVPDSVIDQIAFNPAIIVVDPGRRRHRRFRGGPLPVAQGGQHERPRSHQHRIVVLVNFLRTRVRKKFTRTRLEPSSGDRPRRRCPPRCRRSCGSTTSRR